GGVFTAGGHEGRATVRVKFGSKLTDQASIQIAVGAERVETRGVVPDKFLAEVEAALLQEAEERLYHVGGHDRLSGHPRIPDLDDDRAVFCHHVAEQRSEASEPTDVVLSLLVPVALLRVQRKRWRREGQLDLALLGHKRSALEKLE